MSPEWLAVALGVLSCITAGASAYLHLKIRSELADMILDRLNGRYLKAEVADEKFRRIEDLIRHLPCERRAAEECDES